MDLENKTRKHSWSELSLSLECRMEVTVTQFCRVSPSFSLPVFLHSSSTFLSKSGVGILFYKPSEKHCRDWSCQPRPRFSTSSEVQSWRESHHETARQQVSRSRLESQTSAGDICSSFLVELGARTLWFTCQCMVQRGDEMMCMKLMFYRLPCIFLDWLFSSPDMNSSQL